MAQAIHINNITFQYKGQNAPAVDNVSIVLTTGKILGLLGPNGAGKTTLIHLICGLLKPGNGSIVFEAMKQNRPGDRKRYIGFVPQQDGLFGEMTLRENLFYFGKLYGISAGEIRSVVNIYTDWLRLNDHLDKKIKHFSGGMNRRANIIAALLHQPTIVIFDEPTAGVDIQSRALIHDVIRSLKEKGTTILYTSHLIGEAEQLCDEIFVIDGGRVLAQGRPEALREMRGSDSLENYLLELTGKEVRD